MSVGLSAGDTVTVTVDGLGTDVTKTDTLDSGGLWSVSLTSDEVKGLDAAAPAAAGEVIAVRAVSGASAASASFRYDPTAPTVAAPVFSSSNANESWAKGGGEYHRAF